jgi:chromosomal replication initiation ATPase DnaA
MLGMIEKTALGVASQVCGITIHDLRHGGRSTQLAEARAIACKLLRDEGFTCVEVMNIVGYKDHGSVIYATGRFNNSEQSQKSLFTKMKLAQKEYERKMQTLLA